MYAQTTEGWVKPELLDELGRVVRREVVPALREEPGFSGALSLVDGQTGRSFLCVFWETDDEAARPIGESGGARLLHALETVGELCDCDLSAPTVWEVSARG